MTVPTPRRKIGTSWLSTVAATTGTAGGAAGCAGLGLLNARQLISPLASTATSRIARIVSRLRMVATFASAAERRPAGASGAWADARTSCQAAQPRGTGEAGSTAGRQSGTRRRHAVWRRNADHRTDAGTAEFGCPERNGAAVRRRAGAGGGQRRGHAARGKSLRCRRAL